MYCSHIQTPIQCHCQLTAFSNDSSDPFNFTLSVKTERTLVKFMKVTSHNTQYSSKVSLILYFLTQCTLQLIICSVSLISSLDVCFVTWHYTRYYLMVKGTFVSQKSLVNCRQYGCTIIRVPLYQNRTSLLRFSLVLFGGDAILVVDCTQQQQRCQRMQTNTRP